MITEQQMIEELAGKFYSMDEEGNFFCRQVASSFVPDHGPKAHRCHIARRAWTEEDDARLRALKDAGATQGQRAAELNRSTSDIDMRLRALGINSPKRKQRPKSKW